MRLLCAALGRALRVLRLFARELPVLSCAAICAGPPGPTDRATWEGDPPAGSPPGARSDAEQLCTVLSPLGQGEDDGPQINSAINADAAAGRCTQLVGGPWTVQTPIDFSTAYGARLIGAPHQRGTFNIPTNTTVLGSLFVGIPQRAPGTVDGTLAATPAIGSNAVLITKTTEPAIGNALLFYHGTYDAQSYDIVAVSGSASPYRVTLDHAFTRPYEAGDLVRELSSYPRHVVIDMRGMAWSGVADRGVELINCKGCSVLNLEFDSTQGTIRNGGYIDMDIGGRDNRVAGCSIDLSGGFGLQGIAFETQEDSVAELNSISASDQIGTAFMVYNGVGNVFRQNTVTGAGNAFMLQADPDNSGLGPYDTQFAANVSVGCYNGFMIGLGDDIALSNNVATNSTATGCAIDRDSQVFVDQLDVSGSGGMAFFAAGQVQARGVWALDLPASGGNGNGRIHVDSGTVSIDDLHVQAVHGTEFAIVQTGANLQVGTASIELGDETSYAMFQVDGTTRVDNLDVTGTYFTGIRVDAGELVVGPGFQANQASSGYPLLVVGGTVSGLGLDADAGL